MYKIEVQAPFKLDEESLHSLTMFYQGLFSYPVLSFYLSLYTRSQLSRTLELKDFLRDIQLGETDFKHYRKELERFGLLRSFLNEDILGLILQKPLTPHEFLLHPSFSRLLSLVKGHERYIELSHFYRYEPPLKGDEITESFDISRLSAWDQKMENEFEKEEKTSETYHPRLKGFVESISCFIFPKHLRTKDVLSVISNELEKGEYNISTLRSAVSFAVDLEKDNFDMSRFNSYLWRNKGKMTVEDVQDPLDMDSISYLKYILNTDQIVDADIKLIRDLSEHFQLKDEVINVLLKYVILDRKSHLSRNYVEKIADSWTRAMLDSKEEAIEYLNKQHENFKTRGPIKHQEIIQPEYSENIKIEEDADELTKSILDKLRKE